MKRLIFQKWLKDIYEMATKELDSEPKRMVKCKRSPARETGREVRAHATPTENLNLATGSHGL